MGPRILPAIKVEAKVRGKKVSKNFNATMNTSVFANQITDLLEKSDGRKIAIEIQRKKKTLGEKIHEKLKGQEEEEENTSSEEAPLEEAPLEETPEPPLEVPKTREQCLKAGGIWDEKKKTCKLPEKKLEESDEEKHLRLG